MIESGGVGAHVERPLHDQPEQPVELLGADGGGRQVGVDPDVARAGAREPGEPGLAVPVEDLPEVEILPGGKRERLNSQQSVGETEAEIERRAAGALGVERDTPFRMGEAPGLAGQRLDVVGDHVHGGHRLQGTVPPMRAVVQRVSTAWVTVDGERVASIGRGLLVLLGVRDGDREEDADRLAGKVAALRVFDDDAGKMNLSVHDVGGELLVVSNFTLYGDARKGNRPSFVEAARPETAEPLVERVRERLEAQGGRFGARMAIELVNDGPVTLVLDV